MPDDSQTTESDIQYLEPDLAKDFNDEQIVDAEVAGPAGELCGACGCPNETGDRFCVACGNPLQPVTGSSPSVDAEVVDEDIQVIEAKVAAKEKQPEVPKEPIQKFFRCETCGAEVGTDLDQRSYICAFCDSTYVVEFGQDQTGRQPPEFVIGFAVTVEQAKEKFEEWIQANGWFRPGDLRSGRLEGKQKGVYLPFWTFSGLAESTWSANIGEYWYKTERYTTRQNGKTVTKTRRVKKTEWWPLSGNHHGYHSGYLVSASKGLPQRQALRIQPFQMPALKRYESYYLAGWLSEEYSVMRDQALEICRAEFDRREQQKVANFLPGDTHQSLQVNTRYSQVQSDLCLLPCYILSYRYKDEVYRFLVNGQTGRCAGDKPLSWKRIYAAIAAGVIGLIVLIILIAILGSY
jgi:DNA-directed RNA polymerase subunit RPC12/RpoP